MSATVWLLVPALPLLWLLSGYAVASRTRPSDPASRLAWAVLTGLSLQLLGLGILNFFRPLDATYSLLCLWPVALALGRSSARRALIEDLAIVTSSPPNRFVLALGIATLLSLVGPEIAQPRLLYYDATANHDGYFWVAGAERLQTHSYMDVPAVDPAHPWANSTGAFSGWKPAWGRAGAEALLAFSASLFRLDPLQAYPAVTAALFAAWIAAVYLVARTFWFDSLSIPALAALVALPSLFVFFRTNANFPNLVGIVVAGGALAATERSLQPGRDWSWALLLTLSVHASLFAYPEMLPFVALPGALVVLRAWRARRAGVAIVLLAVLAGAAVNPATTLRALHGFLHSFDVARSDTDWANPFVRIHWQQYAPALATLSLPAVKFLGPLLAGLAGLLLAAATLLALQRARDRFGALATLSGFVVLLGYTLVTGFSYGWQKSVQFSAVFLTALLPVAAVEAGVRAGRDRFLSRWAARTLAGAVVALFAMAMVFHALESSKWRERRHLTSDWRDLRTFVSGHLCDRPILVEPATFPMAFFHGMWSAWFLRDAGLVYARRGDRNGGYLHNTVATEAPGESDPAAVLVGRQWADTFDADSPRLFTGDDFVLLRRANRVTALEGVTPDEGVPESSAGRAAIEIHPHGDSELHLALIPATGAATVTVYWRVICRRGDRIAFQTEHVGPGAWNLVVPLSAGELHRVEIDATAAALCPFNIDALRVVARP